MKTTRVLAMAGMAALLLASGVRMSAEPSSTPRLDWVFDNQVTGTARIGNTLYAGGWFTSVAPAAGELSRLFELSSSTGAPVPGLPAVNGAVLELVPDGSGGYYVAGEFTNIGSAGLGAGGQPSAQRIAHVLANGTVDPGFRPPVGGQFMAMARVGPSLVVAGSMFVDNGTTARNLAAVNPVTGALVPWVPALPGTVSGIAASGGAVFVLTSDAAGAKRVTAFDAATGGALWTSAVIAGASSPVGPLTIAGSRLVVALDRLYAVDPSSGTIDAAWGSAAPPTGTQISALAVSGTSLYVAGSFAAFGGQARANLAAVDVATGTLLPWAPQASAAVQHVVASLAGDVFVQGASTLGTQVSINGQQRTSGLFKLDAAGAVTAWESQARFVLSALYPSPAGSLVVGAVSVPSTGNVARAALAAFDLANGTLMPNSPTFGSTTDRVGVTSLVSLNQTLFVAGQFDTVNGQPYTKTAALDATSGTVRSWPAAPVEFFAPALAFAHDSWVYVYLSGGGPLRRIHAVTGVLDPVWKADRYVRFFIADVGLAVSNGELYATQGYFDTVLNEPVLVIGQLDEVTGAMRPLARAPGMVGAVLTVDGDTAYLALPGTPTFFNVGVVEAYDLRTGRRVSAPAVTGQINGLTAADGRLFAYGGTFRMGATSRIGAAEVVRPASFTAWAPGAWRLDGPDVGGIRGVRDLRAHGNVLVAMGLHESVRTYRIAAFDLNGVSAPSNLRSSFAGTNTVFAWDPVVPPPSGGYVIEGGFGPGQTAAALPVGGATSVALPVPLGPVHVRVRTQGGTEVSNELVAGCVAPPRSPTGLTAAVAGSNLTLSWTPSPGAVTTTLLAGTTSGSSNLATVPLAGQQTSIAGPVPAGTYFVRMTSANACGTSASSGEVFVTMGAAEVLPAAPTNLAVSLFRDIFSFTATFTWTPPPGAVTGHQIEVGTGLGLADLATAPLGAGGSFVVPNLPPGLSNAFPRVYYVRVRAVNSAGSGAPSADVVVVVP